MTDFIKQNTGNTVSFQTATANRWIDFSPFKKVNRTEWNRKRKKQKRKKNQSPSYKNKILFLETFKLYMYVHTIIVLKAFFNEGHSQKSLESTDIINPSVLESPNMLIIV